MCNLMLTDGGVDCASNRDPSLKTGPCRSADVALSTVLESPAQTIPREDARPAKVRISDIFSWSRLFARQKGRRQTGPPEEPVLRKKGSGGPEQPKAGHYVQSIRTG